MIYISCDSSLELLVKSLYFLTPVLRRILDTIQMKQLISKLFKQRNKLLLMISLWVTQAKRLKL